MFLKTFVTIALSDSGKYFAKMRSAVLAGMP